MTLLQFIWELFGGSSHMFSRLELRCDLFLTWLVFGQIGHWASQKPGPSRKKQIEINIYPRPSGIPRFSGSKAYFVCVCSWALDKYTEVGNWQGSKDSVVPRLFNPQINSLGTLGGGGGRVGEAKQNKTKGQNLIYKKKNLNWIP